MSKEQIQFPSETFCALPWVHLSTRPSGHMRVCCTANASGVQNADSSIKNGEVGQLKNDDGMPANLSNTPFSEAWNSSYMRNTRKMMLNGEKPASCIKCFKEEEAGHRSKRQWETEYWIKTLGLEDIIGSTEEDGKIHPKIRYIDLRLGTKCQLACVMCSPADSSGWIKEHKIIFPKLENKNLQASMRWEKDTGRLAETGGSYNWHKNNPTFMKELFEQIPHLYQLYWAGGEALIMDDHYTILEEIIRQGYASQIELRYNSNGLEWRDDLFDLWSKFRRVIFHFSIDDIEDRLNFIRYPTPWEKCAEQLHKIDNYPHDNLKLTTAFTVLALNMYYIPEFVEWKLSQNFKRLNSYPNGAGIFSCHLAYWPPQLNVKALPKWFKQEIRMKFEQEFFPWLKANWKKCTGIDGVSYEEWSTDEYGLKRFEGLLNFMDAEDWSQRLPETAEWCYNVANMRNLDFDRVFPDLEWLKQYKGK
jgi:hypothetical protein